MRLGGYSNGHVVHQVPSGLQQQLGIVPERAQAKVAVVAQQPANLSSLVVVVKMQAVRSAVQSIWRLAADRALTILFPVKTLPFFNGNLVGPLKVVGLLGPLRVSGRKILVLRHILHRGVVCGGVSLRWVIRASRFVLLHLATAEHCVAPRARVKYPSAGTQGFSLFATRVLGEPFLASCRVARLARVVLAGLLRRGVREVRQVSRLLASRTHLLLGSEFWNTKALVSPVSLNVAMDDDGMAPLARYWFGRAGRFGHFVKCLRISEILNSLRHQPQGTVLGGRPTGRFAVNFSLMGVFYDRNYGLSSRGRQNLSLQLTELD